MSAFTKFSSVKLPTRDNPYYILTDDLVYERYEKGSGLYIFAPEGTRTDFTSLPWICTLFWKKDDPRWINSSILHDFLWSQAKTIKDYQLANEVFYEAMRVEGSPRWIATCFFLMSLAELYASIPYESLNDQDIKMFYSMGIFNGFGGGGSNPIIKFFIERICGKFNIAHANRHDFGFFIGGTIARFHECNLGFYRAMKQDAMAVPGISKYYYLLISFLAYTAIELFGKKYFNFH